MATAAAPTSLMPLGQIKSAVVRSCVAIPWGVNRYWIVGEDWRCMDDSHRFRRLGASLSLFVDDRNNWMYPAEDYPYNSLPERQADTMRQINNANPQDEDEDADEESDEEGGGRLQPENLDVQYGNV